LKKKVYHTALKKANVLIPEDVERSLNYFEKDGNIAFKYDLTKGMHEKFKSVDVIYSEISWKAGFKVFKERVGEQPKQKEYEKYLDSVKEVIDKLEVPAFITGGRGILKHLNPDDAFPVFLWGSKVELCLFNGAEVPRDRIRNNFEIMSHVAENFNKGLDFSCGFGNFGKAMQEKGKNFVCSDLNGKCIFYLAKWLMNYK